MEPNDKPTLLDELDARQDEVLAQLDELNTRIETLIGQWTQARKSDGDPAESGDLAAASVDSAPEADAGEGDWGRPRAA